jgi:ferritin-like metal-binding protein YciE
MGIFSANVEDLRALYETELQRALNSEKQIVEKGLPAMIENATNPELKQAFTAHLEESKEHVSRLERILDQLNGEVEESKCKVTATLISSAESDVKDAKDKNVRDVVLIAAGNQVEHHEIAVYGTLRTWAEVLGEDSAAKLLQKTLAEEEKADELLSQLATKINVEAPVA